VYVYFYQIDNSFPKAMAFKMIYYSDDNNNNNIYLQLNTIAAVQPMAPKNGAYTGQ
jgi:hypothetical protein